MHTAEYGILYTKTREKALLEELNQHLAVVFDGYGPAKLSKTKSAIMLEARLPFVYTHFYSASIKKYGVYLELYPNTDTNLVKKFPKTEASWVLFVNPSNYYTDNDGVLHHTVNPRLPELIQALLDRLSMPSELLHTYTEGEERL